MRNHIAVKFIAVLLCSVFLFSALVTGFGIAALLAGGLYQESPYQLQAEEQQSILYNMAYDLARRYALEHLGGCPEELIYEYFGAYTMNPETYLYNRDYDGDWYYAIKDSSGKVLEADGTLREDSESFIYTVSTDYYLVIDRIVEPMQNEYEHEAQTGTEATWGGYDMETVDAYEGPDMTMPAASVPPTQEPVPEATQVSTFVDNYRNNTILSVYDYAGDAWIYYAVEERHSPELTVVVRCDAHLLRTDYWDVIELFWECRYEIIWVFALSLLLFAVCAVYLCCAAGRKPGSEGVKAAGLNDIPLDLYGGAAALGIFALLALAQESSYWFDDYREGFLAFLAAEAYAGSLLIVAFCFACAAQFKMGGTYWLKHSFIGICVRYGCKALVWCWNTFLRFCGWLDGWLPDWLAKVFGTLWRWTKTLCVTLWKWFVFLCRQFARMMDKLWELVCRGCGWIGHYVNRAFSMLPMTWQWLLVGFVMIFLIYFAVASYSGGAMLVGMGLTVAIILYGASCFGILLEGVKRMSKGDLDTKVSDQFLTGSFREFAGDLNALADVAVVAAQKQMKSERMKAELVTNVSHDIKTPLTSIINYVDLLQKAATEEEKEQYLEVLERQSQRMKKLIEDLMEMSKATTGNMPVEIQCVEAAETINQALGEFADKLAAVKLTPIFKAPEEPVYMRADGRLAWRVLSNLLSNAVKYALPGTRLYIDLVSLDDKVLISLKNISKEQLNVSSEELMERFVRGDASRNTEGSGLGLNIAKSLMDLQHGQLQLLVDGDLFKATLIFPAVKE